MPVHRHYGIIAFLGACENVIFADRLENERKILFRILDMKMKKIEKAID